MARTDYICFTKKIVPNTEMIKQYIAQRGESDAIIISFYDLYIDFDAFFRKN